MKKYASKLSVLVALLALNGCADSNDSDSVSIGDPCTANVCDGNTLNICSNGVIVGTMPCANGCANNACVEASTCTNGAQQCGANAVQTCVNGAWVDTVPCTNGCENNACKPAATSCNTGDKQCGPNGVQVCANNQWYDLEACPNGCENNACKPAAAACTNGALQCGVNSVQTCVNGVWVDSVSCPNGCANNACIGNESSTCIDGAKQCNGKNVDICINNTWVAMQTCDYQCSNADCVAKPIEDNCTQTVCSDKTLVVCISGKPTPVACPYGCKDAKCNSKICDDGVKQCSGNTLQICANNDWISSSCPYGCENNACKPAPAETCTNGAKQCAGNAAQVCQNNVWVTIENCTNGCNNGSCNGSSTTEACDYYDCSSDYAAQCKSQFGEPNAICDDEGAYCVSLSNAGCPAGETKVTSGGESYCMIIGSSEACLMGGSSSGWEDCSTETCSMQDGTSIACGQACKQYGGSSEAKAWCDASGQVSCSDPTGGITGDYEVCDNSCMVSESMTCAQYCKSQGSDVCYMDDEYIYCQDPNQGGDYEDCSSEKCQMQDGTSIACGQACMVYGGSSEPKAWCDSTGSVICEDPNGGTDPTPEPEACDYYDCSSDYAAQCKSQFGEPNAICDDEGAYCVSLSNSGCAAGETKVTSDGESYCLVIGSSEACLMGGSSSGWEDCSSETCTMTDGSSMACGQACKQYGGSSEAKAWCDASGKVSCSEPSGSAGDYEVCDNTCKVEGGMTCAQYCQSQGSDVCYMDDQYIYCEDPNQGGHTGSGEACNEETYVESCKGNVVNYCYDGEVDSFECDSTAPCKVNASTKVADCAEACSASQNGKSLGYYCMDFLGMMLSAPKTCTKTTDGDYAVFLGEMDFCEGACDETKGCL